MHGVRRELLARQAHAAGLALIEVEIPAFCPNSVYEQRMGQALGQSPLRDVEAIAFGDLFLADIRGYREARLAAVGKRAIFPLWGRNTGALAREFIDVGQTVLRGGYVFSDVLATGESSTSVEI